MTSLGVVVLVVMVDLLGFTLVMPLLAPFAEQYGFEDWQIGFLFSAYPICQLVAGPILGRLSDRYGRKPLLIFSQAGTAASFLILGLSRDFSVMLLARMLDGASGGNILVAQAYVADVTEPEHRARGMGLIGMAFGVGFVLGPLLGGLLLSIPLPLEWRLRLPFLVAAAFSTLAWLLVLYRLPESRSQSSGTRVAARTISWRGIADTVSLPGIGLLVLLGFLSVLAFAAFEGTFALFLARRLRWNAQTAAFAFAGLGFLSALVQGGLIRRFVPRFGEARLIVSGLILAACGFASLSQVSNLAGLIGALALLGLGQGILSPSVSGLLSRITPIDEQGAVFGTFTSAQTLARMISYSAANFLLGRVSTAAPYWGACGIDLVALAIAGHGARRFRKE
jgi:DHA1 family tetracycline resistance protein-like MFS transporter